MSKNKLTILRLKKSEDGDYDADLDGDYDGPTTDETGGDDAGDDDDDTIDVVAPEELDELDDDPECVSDDEIKDLIEHLTMEFTTNLREAVDLLGQNVPLEKAWSDSARSAAAATRKSAGTKDKLNPFGNVKITHYSPAATTVEAPKEARVGVHAPDTRNTVLGAEERPHTKLDSRRLLVEKYGVKHGNKSFQSLMDRSDRHPGLHHIIANKIQREKKAMMNDLGKEGHPDQHHYQGLHKMYMYKNKGVA